MACSGGFVSVAVVGKQKYNVALLMNGYGVGSSLKTKQWIDKMSHQPDDQPTWDKTRILELETQVTILYRVLKYAVECIEGDCIPGNKWLERAKSIVNVIEVNKDTN